MAWHKFFMEVDPDIVTGYNIAQFDIHYLLERASVLKVVQFPYFGRIKCRSTFPSTNVDLISLESSHSATTSAKDDLIFLLVPAMKDVSFSTFITISGNIIRDYQGKVPTSSIMCRNTF